jgi:hypothetical protein
MTTVQRRLSILIGVVGSIGVCGSCFAVGAFLHKIWRNGLVVPTVDTARAFYRTVGSAYSGGFLAGFSLCFFLTLLAVAVSTWFGSRRDLEAPRTETVRIPVAGKRPQE